MQYFLDNKKFPDDDYDGLKKNYKMEKLVIKSTSDKKKEIAHLFILSTILICCKYILS